MYRALTFIALLIACLCLAPAALAGDRIVTLTSDNRLITIDSSQPGMALSTRDVTGLEPNEDLLAIDIRPATGKLYGLGSSGRLYTLNRQTGVARQVGAAPFAVPLSGTEFGFDFDPVSGVIRVVSTFEQNMRIHPDSGLVIDTSLAPGVQTDAPLSPPGFVGALAYDRNGPGAGQTTAWGIDSAANTLVRIGGVNGSPSPSGGAVTTVGSLGVDPTQAAGFDFSSPSNSAYAALTVGGAPQLYRVNIGTGAATVAGPFPAGALVRDLAVPAAAPTIWTLAGTNQLVQRQAGPFQSAQPPVMITGLQAGEGARGIDVAPATGQLYLLGTQRLYRVNPTTGAATPVSNNTLSLVGSSFGFDYSPVSERFRVVSDAEQNLRVHPFTGGSVTDANLSPSGEVTAIAYTNSVPGSTFSTLYGIDTGSPPRLVRIGGPNGVPTPNGGQVTDVGTVGSSFSASAGLDAGDGYLLAALNDDFSNPPSGGLYWIDPVNAATRPIISLSGISPYGLAIAPSGRFYLNAPVDAVPEGNGQVTLPITRANGSANGVTVEVATSDGGAAAGEDYDATARLVRLDPGQTQATVTVPIDDDAVDEPDETFTVTLSDPTSGATVALGTGTVTIADDDLPPPAPPAPPAGPNDPGTAPPSGDPGAPGPGAPGSPGAPGAPANAAPVLSRLSLANRRFRVGRTARRRGTRFRFTLSEAARVTFTIQRATRGRRVGRACRRATRRLRRRRACVRYVRVGTIRVNARAGANSIRFSGRLRRRALRPGRYRAVAVAADAGGQRSVERRAGFRVLR